MAVAILRWVGPSGGPTICPTPTHLPTPACWYCLHPSVKSSGKIFLSSCKVHLALGFSSWISSWNICSHVLGSENDIGGESWDLNIVSSLLSCSILAKRERKKRERTVSFSGSPLTFSFHFLPLAFGFQGAQNSSSLERQKAAESCRRVQGPSWTAQSSELCLPARDWCVGIFSSFVFPLLKVWL